MIWLDEGGQQRDLRLIVSPPPLRDVVEHFWIQETMPKHIWRIVPDVSGHVIFSITSRPSGVAADCCVVGARSEFFDLDVTGRTVTIGVRLRPGTLPLLVRDSAAQFTDRSIPFDQIFGGGGSSLVDLMAERAPLEAVKLLAQFLSQRFDFAAAPVASALLPGATSVTDLADAICASRRSIYNWLSATVGLSPKRALRIQRLHEALKYLNNSGSLADAAAGAGYSDQAHFTREAVSLLGEAPGAWRSRGLLIRSRQE